MLSLKQTTKIKVRDAAGFSIWAMNLVLSPAINAPPMTFSSGNKQYVAIEVGLGGAWPQWFVSATPELKEQVPSNMLYVFELP